MGYGSPLLLTLAIALGVNDAYAGIPERLKEEYILPILFFYPYVIVRHLF